MRLNTEKNRRLLEIYFFYTHSVNLLSYWRKISQKGKSLIIFMKANKFCFIVFKIQQIVIIFKITFHKWSLLRRIHYRKQMTLTILKAVKCEVLIVLRNQFQKSSFSINSFSLICRPSLKWNYCKKHTNFTILQDIKNL